MRFFALVLSLCLFASVAHAQDSEIDEVTATKLMARADGLMTKGNPLKAVTFYQNIITGGAKTSLHDDALFELARAYEALGKKPDALKVYKQLLKTHPGSPHVPAAMMAYGEFFFEQHQIPMALKAFESVAQYPSAPERLPALQKIAVCHYNMADYTKALNANLKVIQDLRRGGVGSDALRKDAVAGLVLAYAEIGKPAKALPFFKKVSDNDAESLAMAGELARLYTDQGKYENAIAMNHALIRHYGAAAESFALQVEILDLTLNLGNKEAIAVEAQRSVLFMKKMAPQSQVVAFGEAQVRLESLVFEIGRTAFLERHRPPSVEYARVMLEMYTGAFPKGKHVKEARGMLAKLPAP